MQPEHLQQLRHLDEQLDGLEERFSRHLEIYSQNNKELMRLGNLIDIHLTEQKKLVESLNPILEFYENFKMTSKITQITFKGTMKGVGVIASFLGLYLLIKQVFHK